MKEILMQVCCAPDLLSALTHYEDETGRIVIYFYNPNIHPKEEYIKRLENVKKVAEIYKLRVIEEKYEPMEFFDCIKNKEMNEEERCKLCMALRIKKTSEAAKKYGIGEINTTLFASPRKDHEFMKNEFAKFPFTFEYINYRSNNGPKTGNELCQIYGIYRQQFCGCSYSIYEHKTIEEDSKNENYKKFIELAGKEKENIFFKNYKKDILFIPEDIPIQFIIDYGFEVVRYIKPKMTFIKRELLTVLNIEAGRRIKIGNWKGKFIVW